MRGFVIVAAGAAAVSAAILARCWIRSDVDRIVSAVVLGSSHKLRKEHREILNKLEGN